VQETIDTARKLMNLAPTCSRTEERNRSGPAARASLPLLRRPHVHHRDLRGRLPATSPDIRRPLVNSRGQSTGLSWRSSPVRSIRTAPAGRLADAIDGGACDPQAHVQPQRRSRVRALDREPALPVPLRRGVFQHELPLVRLADPGHHREAIASWPLLLHAIGQQTRLLAAPP
jgi:hypothetical protein